MSTVPASADLAHWPDRLAALLSSAGGEPADDALRRAAELGRALAQAQIPLAEVTAAPWAIVAERLRHGAVLTGAQVQAVSSIVRRLMEGYTAAVLRREKDRVQQYLDIAGVMFVALDAQGRITLANKKACAILGCDEDDLIGQPWFDRFVPERDRSRVKPAFGSPIAGNIEPVEYYENPVLTSTGAERLIAWHNALLRNEAGDIVGTVSSGEDVTERKQAEEEARQHHEHLAELVEQHTQELKQVNARLQEELKFSEHVVTGVPAVICRIAPDGTTLFVNPAGERITGYPAEELVGRNWWRVFYPGDEARQVERLFEIFRQGNVRDYEMVLTTKTGAKRTISWNSINWFDADGRLTEIIGFGNDVTERRQADLAVRESEERFRQLAENMSGFFWLYDLATRKVLYVGPGYEPLWGRTRESVYADPDSWLAPIHPDDRAEVMEGWRRQRRGESTEQVYRINRADGTVRWIRTRGFPIRDAAGSVQRLAGIEDDVTEQREAERELRAFKTVSDRAGYGSAIVDLDGKITYVNEAFAAMHGRTVRELLGQPLSVFHNAGQMARVDALNERLRREGRFVAEEVWHVRADGREFPALMSGTTILDDQGRAEFMAATAIDITDRKRAEEALRASEHKFRTLAETVSVFIMIVRGDRVLYANSAAEAILGYSRQELMALESAWTTIHPDFRELARARGHARQRGESVLPRYELKLLTKAGTERWVDLAASRFEFEGATAVLATGVDITDRKQVEEALQVSETNFRTLAETIPVAITITRGPRVLYVNSAAEAITGYDRQELMGLESYWDVVHPDFRELVRERGVARERGEPVPSRYEIRLLPKGGEERWVELSASFFEFDGAPATLATGIDVTDRKRAEEALRIAQERLELALRGADLGVWDWNVPTGHMTYDERSARMMGYAPGELTSDYRTLETQVHPDDRPRVRDTLQAHLAGLTPFFEAEHRLRTKSGEWKWILARGQVVVRDERGAPIRCTGTHLDLTDRKRAEEAVRTHREQLAHASRVSLVGQMASGLAHEMAQPLSAMLYYARGCSSRLDDGAWGIPEARQTLGKIATQAERAGKVIHRLKAFVRRAEPQRLPADINTLVRDVLDLSVPDTRANRVAVRLELADGLPAVNVDQVEIEQVILNLIRNGIDAMGPNAAEARELVIRTGAGPGAQVVVSVEDNGPGVPRDLEQRVFEPFFTTKPAGTGLGLPISRSIIEAHGGTLQIEAGSPRGARFSFSLPAAAGEEEARG
jgi:PAS domain S-box-containing protein